jgi:hypothetical protein
VIGDWRRKASMSSSVVAPQFARTNQPMSLVASMDTQLLTARSDRAAAKRPVWPIAQPVMKPP